MPVVHAVVPGKAFGSRYTNMGVVLLAVPGTVLGKGRPEELARIKSGDHTAAVTLYPVSWLPLRTLVFFRDTTMWLELLWHDSLGNHQVYVHRLDVAGLVEPGKNGKTRPGDTPRRLKRATDMLRFTTPPGRKREQAATQEELDARSALVAQAQAYKEKNPDVTWAQIARSHLGISPGQLDHARREARRAAS